MAVERFTITRYRCEHCGKTFETLADAKAHEAVCIQEEFRTRSLLGKWVTSYDGTVGMAAATRKADSFIGVATPFYTSPVWVSPSKVTVISEEEAKTSLSGQLDAWIRAIELKSVDFTEGVYE